MTGLMTDRHAGGLHRHPPPLPQRFSRRPVPATVAVIPPPTAPCRVSSPSHPPPSDRPSVHDSPRTKRARRRGRQSFGFFSFFPGGCSVVSPPSCNAEQLCTGTVVRLVPVRVNRVLLIVSGLCLFTIVRVGTYLISYTFIIITIIIL